MLIIIVLTSNCAKRGSPSGGKKDSIAPLMVTANPPYKSIHFKSDKIKIYFDEYITLKDVTRRLVISPPLKYNPTITPQGTPSKHISIKITDTLKTNTTYTFNFGNSIRDNNEGNKLESFKYIFSTGEFIDSLKVRGSVKDAFNKEVHKNTTVLLYEINDKFTDSIIYKQKPDYITSTLDSTLFDITNVKKGKYLLVALKDASINYLFNPLEDKIGVYDSIIKLPRDSILKSPIIIYKEVPPFKLVRPREVSKGHIVFGFQGNPEKLKIELLSKISDDFKSVLKFEADKDTLNYWHSIIKNDSINFKITAKDFTDTITVFLRKKKIDSLKINSNVGTSLDLKDTLTLTSNNPIIKIDTSRIYFVNKDSIKIFYKTKIDKISNKISFLFDKKHNTKYKITLYPKALTDVFKTQNDTLRYLFSTKEPESYGSISVEVQKNTKFPVIIELHNEKDEFIQRFFVNKNKSTLNFDLLKPDKYIIRAIVDYNDNKKWDTGNYLKKQQPERVIYHPVIFKVRPNWHFPETFVIDQK